MELTIRKIIETMTELLGEAATVEGPMGMETVAATDGGMLALIQRQIAPDEWSEFVGKSLNGMTQIIAEKMSEETGAPVLAVASAASEFALMNFAAYMLAVGMRLKAEEFAAADVSDADIESTIAQILGGSNG